MTDTPIRVGIIGAHPERGWVATAHLPALEQLPQFRGHYRGPSFARNRAGSCRDFGISDAVATTPELVNRSDVHLVVITVKVTRHRERWEGFIVVSNAGGGSDLPAEEAVAW